MIYLDNAATTYPKPETVYAAMNRANRELAFNSGRGGYRMAREAVKIMDQTRALLCERVSAKGAKVIFSSSITIALNQILKGLKLSKGDNVYISPYEHNAVARTIFQLENEKGISVHLMPVKEDTHEMDVDKLRYLFITKPPVLVCCIHISNVTGYRLPVEEIFKAAKEYDAVTVLDTAQSLGLVEVNAKKLPADFIAFAGHKSLYGPFGIGGFIHTGGQKLKPVLTGGTGSASLTLSMPENFPDQYEPGSPNITAIAGLYAALLELTEEKQKEILEHEKELIQVLVKGLSKMEEVILYLPPQDCQSGVLSFNIQGYLAEDVGIILDEDYDIAVRTGYHCAPYVHDVLRDKEYQGTVRTSVSQWTGKEDVEKLLEAVGEIIG